MYKYVTHLILLLLCGVAVSCNSAKKDYDSALYIDLDKEQEISLFDIFSQVEIIPLETAESVVMGEPVIEMRVHNGQYYFTCGKQESIWHFDADGTFLQEINHYGNGPGEYTNLVDFRFNRFSGDLEILSAMGYISVYNDSGSVFKKRLSFNQPDIKSVHNYIELTPTLYLLFSGAKEGNKMVWYDVQKNRIIAENYALPTYLFFYTPYHHSFTPFYCFQDTVHFVQAYDGEVFTVNNTGEITSKYQFDFGEYTFDISNLKEESVQYYVVHARTIGAKYANRFIVYGENSKYYITRFKFHNRLYHLFVDKKKGFSLIFKRFKEDCLCFPLYMDEECLYFIATPQELNMAINKNVLSEDDKRKYEGVSSDNNPIVIKYTFK